MNELSSNNMNELSSSIQESKLAVRASGQLKQPKG